MTLPCIFIPSLTQNGGKFDSLLKLYWVNCSSFTTFDNKEEQKYRIYLLNFMSHFIDVENSFVSCIASRK